VQRKFFAHVCRAEGLACADWRARTPIGMSGNFTAQLVNNMTATKRLSTLNNTTRQPTSQASQKKDYLLNKLTKSKRNVKNPTIFIFLTIHIIINIDIQHFYSWIILGASP
jgi:hypothetical protein